MIPGIVSRIFSIKSQDDFTQTALEVFKYQADENRIYRRFLEMMGTDPSSVGSLKIIPFLPAGFFRDHIVITGDIPARLVFESSGTTVTSSSRHYIADPDIYRESLMRAFSLFYGDPSEYFIAAILPSYTERGNSSLVYMMDILIGKSRYDASGFYRDDITDLLSKIDTAKSTGQKVFLIGVSFALLDLAEKYHPALSGVIVMETGGMKGRRKEITRSELHSVLKKGLNVEAVHSEYGMTELLSQAYSKSDGLFQAPPWMKIMIRDPQDPLSYIDEPGRTGGISIIDLANIHSCSFIATDDLGRLHEDGGFEVLGRFDNSDVRGCNLLIE